MSGPTADGLRRTLAERVLVCDGAMGTMLHAAGNSLDQALPALNLSDPELVRTIHDSYVDAGVDIVQTNSFGAGRLRLADHGFADRTEEINRAAVRIAREAALGGRHPLVAGSVSPAVSVRQRRRVTRSERVDALREQLTALVDGGVDLVLLETFGYLDELVEAVDVAAEVSAGPVIAQATFGGDGHTLSGHTARDVAAALAGAPIVAIGTNCTLGPQRSLAVVRELREHSDLPLTAQPNAGLPRRVAPARFEYDIDSEYFVRYVRQLLDAGVAVVGGCCGTTPTQLAAVAQAVTEHRARTGRPTAVTTTPRPAPTPAPFAEPAHTVVVELTPDLSGGVDEALDLAGQLPDAGVQFLITRPVYDLAGLERLLDAIDHRPPVLVAIRPLTSFEEAEYLAHEVPDVTIPRPTLTALDKAGPEAPRTGLDLAADLAHQIRHLANGIVITPGPDPLPTIHRLTTP